MRFSVYSYSEIGPRNENQDSFCVAENDDRVAVCVADGVGGNRCGGIASKIAVDEFASFTNSLKAPNELILDEIHKKIVTIQNEKNECAGMATTLTGYVAANWILTGIHVGDSRLCILRGNGIKQLTEDHSEWGIFRSSPPQQNNNPAYTPRKNLLLSALGADNFTYRQYFEYKIEPGDRLLLSSDGVHEKISKLELRDLSKFSPTVQAFGQAIVGSILEKGLRDNATFIVVEFNV